MKPLTIEELRNLEVGDWVWGVVLKSDWVHKAHNGKYYQIQQSLDELIDKELRCGWQGYSTAFEYSDYGTKWIAYKNKEQSEAKGEIVELPRIEPFETCNIETGEPITAYNVLYRDKTSGELIIDCEVNKSEAERRLAELKGEKL